MFNKEQLITNFKNLFIGGVLPTVTINEESEEVETLTIRGSDAIYEVNFVNSTIKRKSYFNDFYSYGLTEEEIDDLRNIQVATYQK